ncbi:hypothetical protein PQX77_006160 [Marasmius sp. AFHP31]|nr:hypothetical protein PQX77_013731 [Marasmius sp. AFHP31]KAK1230745.1 hypothetical protein PQX77_006160 [Marasmius sp. AFHP31]
MASHAESSTQVPPSSITGSSQNPHTHLSDSDDNTSTPRGPSPDVVASNSSRKRSLRFSDSNRPRMSHLPDKQSPSPAQVQGTTDLVESPIEECSRQAQCERERPTQRDETDSDSDSQNSSQRGSRGWKFEPVLVLENSGSVARDHLASERTFLAYVRTSLAIASTGVALVQLFTIAAKSVSNHPDQLSFTPATKRVQAWARPLGVVTVSLGIAVLMIGVLRYFTVQNALVEGKFPVARFLVAGVAFVLGILVTVVFGVLVSGAGPRG